MSSSLVARKFRELLTRFAWWLRQTGADGAAAAPLRARRGRDEAVARVRRVSSRTAGRGEDCTGPRGCPQGAARGVEVEKGRAPGVPGEIPPAPVPLAIDPGARFPGSLGRERETPAGGGIPRGKGNMTDERIDVIGGVTPEATCTECRPRPRWAGSLWCEPCYVRLGIMDGTAALARLGESAS